MREGWTYKKIGECFPYIKNGANIKQIKGAKGYPITRIETLSGGVFNRDRMGYADIFDINKFQDYILRNGDLLMSHINSKAYIGRTVQYTSQNDEVIIHGMNLLRLRSNEGVILSSFFKYYTDSWHFKTDIASIRKDAVNQSSFAISDLKNFKVPIPSLSEQQSIVAELDKINELISLKKAQLSDLDNLAQSIFYDMFGDPIENEKGWEVKKLGEACSLKAGKSIKASDLVEKKDNIFPCYGGNGIRGYIDRFSHEMDLPIIGRQGALCGNVNFAKGPFYATEHAVVVTPVVNLDVVWLYYILKGLRLENYAHGVAQPGISVGDLNPIPLPIPPLSLQQDFAKRIELIEQQKAQISSTVKDLETLLASRMQYWFD